MKTIVKWTDQMAFSGLTPSGHEIKIDAAESVGGQNSGARPTELLMQAVAGCTGIDIISILKKMRLEPVSFHMELEEERAEDHPKRFTNINIHYALEGELPEDKVIRAIKLSKDKYCSVSHTLNATIEVSYSINGSKGEKTI
ncbi:OsmC family protein [Aquibacillus sp. 3ASR75-11]|uniref:OsmC family protein n=1 Tax=Terrihalobacillus insolitus TaxID=2950438 RepID=A0A9X4ALT9_9BACI|nr:OsmC family protein [Terrihalobacillus insolitus]MDC3415281.1 OsmC family protein [Terrihalobacillus insolitus]MDC3424601.1 OsmC family protein [Terrihalobacillus insolitus]